ncbi:MAG: glycine cleavage system protein GcvH [Deltaproteobacteria bacterium]|nr:glycine cleavage system protein GcvH [Deltaproteobacteria bacterium]
MQYPPDRKYHPEHMWVKVEDGEALVGISDFAQDQLGKVVYVDVPQPGDEIAAGQEMGAVESAKSVSDLVAPVDGLVLAANQSLGDQPSLINEDPYGQGWIARVKLTDPGQLDSLLDAAAYGSRLA